VSLDDPVLSRGSRFHETVLPLHDISYHYHTNTLSVAILLTLRPPGCEPPRSDGWIEREADIPATASRVPVLIVHYPSEFSFLNRFLLVAVLGSD
jgi:hypothetical protein